MDGFEPKSVILFYTEDNTGGMRLLSGLRHLTNELVENYDDRHWWRGRISHRIIQPFHKHVYPTYRDGIEVMEQDWDTLVILDGCRADLFEEVVDLSGFDEYQRVKSLGGATGEWTRRNFSNRKFGDTVYVTANPNPSKLAADSFHDLREVWREAFDDEVKTVFPDAVIDEAKAALAEYPDKRLIVHFMQPHRPFVRREDLQFNSWVPETGGILESDPDRPYMPWDALEMGVVDYEQVWEGYADNLDFVYEYVDEFVRELSGRTVITSDHGNLVGERGWPVPIRLYGHQSGLRTSELITVPWAVIEEGERREIVAGEVGSRSEATTTEVEKRLRDLGYHE